MKKRLILLIILIPILCIGQNNNSNDLESELANLNTKTALVMHSQAIDEFPIWSESSDFIGFNLAGKWKKIRLTDIELKEVTWRNSQIGYLTTEDAISEMTEQEVSEFQNVSKFQPREAITSDGTKIELKMEQMRVSLIVTEKGGESNVLWTSGGENCHSLSVSPNEKYVAYLCELNGLLIMKIK